MTNSTLSPEWQPIVLPWNCARYPLKAFPSTVIADPPIIVVGGPAAISVCQLGSRQNVLFSIAVQVQLAGYAVNAETLYVQDGPVLSAWNLQECMCFSAYNLATGTKSQGASGGALTAAQLAAVYQLSPAQAVAQPPLQAPNRAAWADLLATVEKMRATSGTGPFGPANVPLTSLNDFAYYLQAVLGPGHSAPSTFAPASVLTGAAPPLFSAPVIRTHQIDGSKGAMVFVLGSDGSIHALDDNLTFGTVSRFDPPASPQLALAEIPAPQDPSNISVRLYYTTATGTVNELNASTIPLNLLGSWPMQGLTADASLPLSFVDGRLWGGGNMGDGDALLALPPDAPTPSTLKVSNEGGPWTQYEVDPAEKLVLLAGKNGMRLQSYGTGVNVPDRWGLSTALLPGWLGFWPGTGQDVQPEAAKLVLNVEELAGSVGDNVKFNVFVANTVDTASLQYASTYPPPPLAVGTGTLVPGAFHGLARIGWVRSKPVVVDQIAYFLARESSPFAAVIAFLTPGATGNRPFDDYVANAAPAPAGPVQDLPPPPLQTEFDDALVAYNLTELATSVKPDANAQIQHLTNFTRGIKIQVSQNLYLRDASDGLHIPYQQPVPITRAIGFRLNINPPIAEDEGLISSLAVTTDSNGVCWIDSKYDGETVFCDSNSFDESVYTYNTNSWILHPDKVQCSPQQPFTLSIDQPTQLTLTFGFGIDDGAQV